VTIIFSGALEILSYLRRRQFQNLLEDSGEEDRDDEKAER
jgi:hypothetical protein